MGLMPLAAMVLVHGMVQAQAVGASPAPSPPAANRAGDLDEIVVTATRREESQSKVAISIKAFDGAALAERGITTETDLQQSVPGLTVKTTASQNQLNYTIRGQTLDAFSGSSPGVLPYFNDVALSNQTATSFYDFASVQVLKGPQGTLFGRNATGGAVLYNSQEPGDTFGGYFTVRNGNYNLREYQGAVDLPVMPGIVDVRVAVDFDKEDGYVKDITQDTNLGDTDAKSARVTVKVTPNDRLTSVTVLQYGSYGGTELNGGLYSYYPLGATNNGYALNTTAAIFYTAGGPLWSPALAALVPGGIAQEQAQSHANPYVEQLPFTPQHRSDDYYAENTSTFVLNSDFTFKNIASVQHHQIRSDAALSGARLGVLDLADYPSTEGVKYKIDQFSEEFQLQGNAINEKLKYIAGVYVAAELDHTDIPTQVGFSFPEPIAFFHHAWGARDHTQAFFVQGTYDLSNILDGLSFTVGGRQTWEEIGLTQDPNSNFAGQPSQHMEESAPSWTAGVQWQATSEWLIYAVSRGSWRAGNFNGTTTPIDDQNKYGPEKTHDFELGTKFAGRLFDHSAQFNFAIYDQVVNYVQRDIYFDIDGAPSSFTHNVPKGEVRGAEVDGQFKITDWLTLGGSGAFTDAFYPDGQVTLFGQSLTFSNYQDTPKWTGSAFATVELPTPGAWGDMSVRSDVYYQTSQAFTSLMASVAPDTLLPSYALVNMRYDWRDVMGSKISVSAYVKNLANRTSYLGGFGLGPDVGFNVALPGAPRKYGGEFTFKF